MIYSIKHKSKAVAFSLNISLICAGCAQLDDGSQLSTLSQAMSWQIPRSTIGVEVDGSDEQGPSLASASATCGRYFLPSEKNKFLACEKLMTAQYYGDGNSFTFEGTLIYFADVETERGKGPRSLVEETGISSRLKYLEAIWGKDGALCLSKPRWAHIHEKFKPTTVSLPNCELRPGSPDKAWAGAPFDGNGLIISYSYNRHRRLLTARLPASGAIISAPDSWLDSNWHAYESLSENIVYSSENRPLHLGSSLWEPCEEGKVCAYSLNSSRIEEDQDVSALRLWKRCTSATCDYISTAADLTSHEARSEREIHADQVYSLTDASLGYILNNPRPGALPLITYVDDVTGEHFTMTRRAAEQVTGRRIRETKSIEGYVYSILVNHVERPASPACVCRCPKYCGESIPTVPGCTPCRPACPSACSPRPISE